MNNNRFFRCAKCENVFLTVVGLGNTASCCGAPLVEMHFGEMDEGKEKHMPMLTQSEDRVYVDVGEREHPMVEDHSISFIYLRTNRGGHLRYLSPTQAPSASFTMEDDEDLRAAYAYCNKHGMWMREVGDENKG